MPARSATFSSVVRSCPISRTSARAASTKAARVRSRLSPFGFPRDDAFFSLVIDKNIVYLFYNLNIKYVSERGNADDDDECDRGRAWASRESRRTCRGRRARLAQRVNRTDCHRWTPRACLRTPGRTRHDLP